MLSNDNERKKNFSIRFQKALTIAYEFHPLAMTLFEIIVFLLKPE